MTNIRYAPTPQVFQPTKAEGILRRNYLPQYFVLWPPEAQRTTEIFQDNFQLTSWWKSWPLSLSGGLFMESAMWLVRGSVLWMVLGSLFGFGHGIGHGVIQHQSSVWSNVLGVSNLKTHSLCQNSKVAPPPSLITHSPPQRRAQSCQGSKNMMMKISWFLLVVRRALMCLATPLPAIPS